MVSPSLFERFELQPGFSAAFGALALVGVLVTARRLRRRRGQIAMLGLLASIIAALAWFANAWAIYDVGETHVSSFGGCELFVMAAMTAVAAALVLLSLAEAPEER
jgi:hypothetical protein